MSHDINILLKTLNCQTKRIEAIYYKLALNFKMSESAFWILYALAEADHEYSQQEISEELSYQDRQLILPSRVLCRRSIFFWSRQLFLPERKRFV